MTMTQAEFSKRFDKALEEGNLEQLLCEVFRPEPVPSIKDLSIGIDLRGDEALFIERRHIIHDGWTLDDEVREAIQGSHIIYFRVIDDGEYSSSHGWIEDGRIVQWG
jgi:hypothetical protein